MRMLSAELRYVVSYHGKLARNIMKHGRNRQLKLMSCVAIISPSGSIPTKSTWEPDIHTNRTIEGATSACIQYGRNKRQKFTKPTPVSAVGSGSQKNGAQTNCLLARPEIKSTFSCGISGRTMIHQPERTMACYLDQISNVHFLEV